MIAFVYFRSSTKFLNSMESQNYDNEIYRILSDIRDVLIARESKTAPEYISLEACAEKLAMSQRQVKSICRDLNIPVIPLSARMNVVNYRQIQDELHKRNNRLLENSVLENEAIETSVLDNRIPPNEVNESEKLEDGSQKGELSQK